MSSEPCFTTLQVEAQLIVWEHIQRTAVTPGNTDFAHLRDIWASLGTPFMRHEAIRVGAYLSDWFNDWQDEFPDARNALGLAGFSYDFVLIPALLAKCHLGPNGFELPDPSVLHNTLIDLAVSTYT